MVISLMFLRNTHLQPLKGYAVFVCVQGVSVYSVCAYGMVRILQSGGGRRRQRVMPGVRISARRIARCRVCPRDDGTSSASHGPSHASAAPAAAIAVPSAR